MLRPLHIQLKLCTYSSHIKISIRSHFSQVVPIQSNYRTIKPYIPLKSHQANSSQNTSCKPYQLPEVGKGVEHDYSARLGVWEAQVRAQLLANRDVGGVPLIDDRWQDFFRRHKAFTKASCTVSPRSAHIEICQLLYT